jgi:ribosomal protein S18 acetylase RimI-like enzyme
MGPLDIRDLAGEELGEAAGVLGRGMRDNPLHLRVFGDDPVRREAALSRVFAALLLQYREKGAILGAFAGRRLTGVCAMVLPGRCQPTGLEKVALLRGVLSGNSLGATMAALRWTSAWARRDPAAAHWHLGPVAVERDLQRKGIGGALLKVFCERMDAAARLAYLETDKSDNVRFYERFGFEVVSEAEVIGVRNWFMTRVPR